MSVVSPRSPQTNEISTLWWWMLGAAIVVFAGAVAILVLAWRRRRSPGLPFYGEREAAAEGMVLLFGLGVPLVALVTLFAIADIGVVSDTAAPSVRSTQLTVDVIGHQWWWEVRYPGTPGVVTANEIHIPVGVRVNLVAQSADVIHSFWVPELARKIDMIPGRANRILLEASKSGVYRGACAEFCGLQHAHMEVYVVAQPAAAFSTWLGRMAAPARSKPAAGAGARAFTALQCASCHQIRGTPAAGEIGPDLTHLMTRATLAAGALPNDPASLAFWIAHPQQVKPGSRMPDLGLSPAEVSSLVTYLESLR